MARANGGKHVWQGIVSSIDRRKRRDGGFRTLLRRRMRASEEQGEQGALQYFCDVCKRPVRNREYALHRHGFNHVSATRCPVHPLKRRLRGGTMENASRRSE